MPNLPTRLAMVIALPLAFAACSDADLPTSPLATEAVRAEGPRAGQGDPADDPTILNVAESVNEATGEFSTLLAVLEVAGLEDALDGRKPLTVFAPTDAAFAALEAANPGILASLLGDTEALQNVLLYHVTRGVRTSPSVVGARQILMLNGERIFPSTNADGAFVNDSKIIGVDVPASNGVIHIIDAVLVPGG